MARLWPWHSVEEVTWMSSKMSATIKNKSNSMGPNRTSYTMIWITKNLHTIMVTLPWWMNWTILIRADFNLKYVFACWGRGNLLLLVILRSPPFPFLLFHRPCANVLRLCAMRQWRWFSLFPQVWQVAIDILEEMIICRYRWGSQVCRDLFLKTEGKGKKHEINGKLHINSIMAGIKY